MEPPPRFCTRLHASWTERAAWRQGLCAERSRALNGPAPTNSTRMTFTMRSAQQQASAARRTSSSSSRRPVALTPPRASSVRLHATAAGADAHDGGIAADSRRQVLLAGAALVASTFVVPSQIARAEGEDFATFLGYATPPTSYGAVRTCAGGGRALAQASVASAWRGHSCGSIARGSGLSFRAGGSAEEQASGATCSDRKGNPRPPALCRWVRRQRQRGAQVHVCVPHGLEGGGALQGACVGGGLGGGDGRRGRVSPREQRSCHLRAVRRWRRAPRAWTAAW